jgi:pimeloyl-ACP methyl ester carboxylesterase
MTEAKLHDGSVVEVTVLGSGPAVLLPVSMTVVSGPAGDQIRAWGGDPSLGHTLAHGLADAGYRVLAVAYEEHLAAFPQEHSLTASALASDLLAVADAGGAAQFAYYGYSWLGLAGLQLAIRTDRLTGLAMGGFPPLGGPYDAMLAVTRAAHRMAVANQETPPVIGELTPGDWEASEVTATPAQTGQYVTLYESLDGFDERTALDRVRVPRLAFAGADDNVQYGPKWNDVRVAIADPLRANREELVARGWTVELIPDTDHLTAMHAARVLPLLLPWLRQTTA